MPQTTDELLVATDGRELTGVLKAARAAAQELADTVPGERAGWLRRAADELDGASSELIPIAMRETSLPEARLTGEVLRTTNQLRLFADVLAEGSYLEATIDHADDSSSPRQPDLRRMLEPLGPVAVFAAGNFPFAFSVAGGDTASALAAGCPVVVKVHPGHPALSHRTAKALDRGLRAAGAPAGIIGLVEGLETGKSLVEAPAIRAVGFTGSLEAGRALFDLAMSRPDPIPFYGELGSLNPVVVLPLAASRRPEELARGLVGSFTLGVGQFCTKPGFVMVPRGSEVQTHVAREIGSATPAAMLNDRTAERFRRSLGDLIGVERVSVLAGDPEAAVEGLTASPVVASVSSEDLQLVRDRLLTECFGPATVLVEYSDIAELPGLVETFPGSLTFSFQADEDELGDLDPLIGRATRLAGRVILNGWPTGVAVTWAQHHGGAWPATTASLHTSVGTTAIRRFLRPVAYQDIPERLLPRALRDGNPLEIPRRVDGRLTLPAT